MVAREEEVYSEEEKKFYRAARDWAKGAALLEELKESMRCLEKRITTEHDDQVELRDVLEMSLKGGDGPCRRFVQVEEGMVVIERVRRLSKKKKAGAAEQPPIYRTTVTLEGIDDAGRSTI